MSYIRYLSMGSFLAPLSLLTYHLSAEMLSLDPTSPWIPSQAEFMTPLGPPTLSSSSVNRIIAIEPTSPYLSSQTGLITELGKSAYSSPSRQTPSWFYFSSQRIYIPTKGEWVPNAAGIIPEP